MKPKTQTKMISNHINLVQRKYILYRDRCANYMMGVMLHFLKKLLIIIKSKLTVIQEQKQDLTPK